MLALKLHEAGKKFQRDWIFKGLNLSLSSGTKLAITGNNGSGKSTLIKCLSAQMPLTEGKLSFFLGQQSISPEGIYRYLTISAPYLELPEEFTLKEFLDFHFQFKNPEKNISTTSLLRLLYLESAVNKPISVFSSGMKQRLKLGICFFSDAPLVLLDEPTSNLDRRGIQWYRDMMDRFGKDKCLVIASNDPKEYDFCEQILRLEDYKKHSFI
ncbi:ABC-type multidrug transport system, ATPase component [Cyclobacterium lianum]|uniref:ABC-type multidrug transport system, ATPase component n=1 Tax=Cyclobacterium lianum TaxID=388280 RepID=A0A1M7QBZ5_9BACT|nr:ATP-binding cassette domain-containing protein [Cyclobacterium lianum]SHN28215.1 ABC-type multidrug transport system, ATPase component [Cyclobacterium lianum]